MGTHVDSGKCVRCDADTVRIISTKIQTINEYCTNKECRLHFSSRVLSVKNGLQKLMGDFLNHKRGQFIKCLTHLSILKTQ